MPTDVVMPQMGESIFEGTITKWLKKTGDAVEKDEPLFEISTDKVDAEIPSPVAGVLTEIKAPEGATVDVNSVVAVIAESGSGAMPRGPAKSIPAEPSTRKAGNRTPEAAKSQPAAPQAPGKSDLGAKPVPGDTSGTDVVMPQMGESIFEGTIVRWLKKAGDQVERDEPLLEISTDKVDAEIPSPVSGVLTEIKVPEGSTVQVNTVVAVIGGASQPQADGAPAAPPAKAASAASEVRAAAPPSPASLPAPAVPAEPGPIMPGSRIRSSPLVRRMARKTISIWPAISVPAPMAASPRRMCSATWRNANRRRPTAAAPKAPAPPGLVPMSRMRSIIAQRMVESRHTSPHAYSVYKIDMTRDCPPSRAREGRLRTAQRRQAHLHALHRRRRGRGAAANTRSSTPRSKTTPSATTRTCISASPWRWSGD